MVTDNTQNLNMNMNSSGGSTKKRRVGEGGGEGDDDDLSEAREELRTISTHMSSMVNMMKNMQEEMKSMRGDMNSMKGEIKHLTEKCDRMEESIDVMQKTQSTNSYVMISRCDGMEKLMLSRFDKVDDKQKYHEVLLKNQKWKYSAPRPSQEYWDSIGVGDVDVSINVETFLQQIQQCTEAMRYGHADGNIHLNVPLYVTYNEEFLPHWEEFASALEQYQYFLKSLPEDEKEKSSLRIWNIELPDNVLNILSKAFRSTHFNGFLLDNNSLEQFGIEFTLNNLLNSNHCLKRFVLQRNPISSENIKLLCRILKHHPSIATLVLDECMRDNIDGYEMLQLIMNVGKGKLTHIDLTDNSIHTGGDTFISNFLTSNPILETLLLDGNQLDDNDAIAIAGALKHNTKLRVLNVRRNNLSLKGWAALRKAEFDDTSLDSAANSNHTCFILYPNDHDDDDDDEFEGVDTSGFNGIEYSHWHDTKYVRQKKIYSILSSRHRNCSNADHFEDVPVEFLPDMLSSIQQYADYWLEEYSPCQGDNDVKPISIMYEILQRWDKSLAVFEALSS